MLDFSNSNKKELATDICKYTDESQKHYAKWEKADSKGHLPYDSIYITFWERHAVETQIISLIARGWWWGKGIDYKTHKGECQWSILGYGERYTTL